jgi:WD40 repeat protein
MKTASPSRTLIGALVLVSSVCAQTPRHKVESEIVGPPWVPGMLYTQSEKGSRVATTYTKDGKWFVAIDNVDGEPFDEILKAASQIVPTYNDADIVTGLTTSPAGPVAFSADGQRYAYAGRRGDEVIVILDGKETFRAKTSQVAPPVQHLQFSPDGKRLFFYNQTGDTMQSFRLMLDGKPVTPAFDQKPAIFFSPDGSRWILNGSQAKQPQQRLLVIDGKEPGYTAERARFSADSKHVVVTTGGRNEQKLLVDGKVVLDTKATIERFRLSPNGDIAALVQKVPYDPEQALFINGKQVPDVIGVRDIRFSPDGKHWAAKCTRQSNQVKWYVVDGKKHQEYAEVSAPYFSPDSSKCVYVAETGQKKFIVTNGEEDEGNLVLRGLAFGKTGSKFAYGGGPAALKIYHDGKASQPYRNVFALQISPDGNRIAYYTANSPTYSDFYVDGELKGGGGAFGDRMVFSPDSKHLAGRAHSPEGSTIYINGRFLPGRRANGGPVAFTPDNKHLLTVGAVPNDQNPHMPQEAWLLDGEVVARFSPRNPTWINSPTRERKAGSGGALPWGVSADKDDDDDWEFLPDGRIVLVGVTVAPGNGYGPLTRFTITPSKDTTFDVWFDDVKAAEEKEAAEALAAKEKAAAEKAAATEKAKAATAEAAAKRKADLEAAAAAKAKARADAAAAKKAKSGAR